MSLGSMRSNRVSLESSLTESEECDFEYINLCAKGGAYRLSYSSVSLLDNDAKH